MCHCKTGPWPCSLRRAFKDSDLHREYKKLTGENPDPLLPEEMERAIREMPRDAEVTDLLKELSARARFLRDNGKGRVRSMAAGNSISKILAVFLSATRVGDWSEPDSTQKLGAVKSKDMTLVALATSTRNTASGTSSMQQLSVRRK